MKNIGSFKPEKYQSAKTKGVFKKPLYTELEDGIYEVHEKEKLYVTSLSFEQEPEYGEGENAGSISQYPLEDILDKFYCHVTDFYEMLNLETSSTCYLEFGSSDVNDIKNLRSIIGKHVYNKENEQDGKAYVDLVIE